MTDTPIIPTEEQAWVLGLTYSWSKTVTDTENNQVYLLVSEELQDYDEGTTYTQYVWQIQGTEVFFQVIYASNSWGEYEEITSLDRVEPRTISKVVYEAVK